MIVGITERTPSDPLPPESDPSLAVQGLRDGMRSIYASHDVLLSSTVLLRQPTDNTVIILDGSHMKAVVQTKLDDQGHDTHTYWLDGTVPERVFRRDTGHQRTSITTSLRQFLLGEHQTPEAHNEVMTQVSRTEVTNFFGWLGGAALIEVD